MTRDDLKKSVQDGTKSFMDSVFTSDIYIRRSNVPVFVMTCLMALAGSMLFGMYFAKQEAQALHAKERAELVDNFASIMKDKDEQIDGLTNVLIVNQKSHDKKLDAIGGTTREIAHFLLNSPSPPESSSRGWRNASRSYSRLLSRLSRGGLTMPFDERVHATARRPLAHAKQVVLRLVGQANAHVVFDDARRLLPTTLHFSRRLADG